MMCQVKIWSEKVTIPTYAVGKAEKNPLFLEKRVYQGSSGKVYPHSVIESVSDEVTMRTYQAVYLENEYIKVMLLPELGGRVQRATDKTNGYDFVYYNQVIKPALVGLTGPWISGGIEFNWPQHHRPSTFDPVEWRMEENSDGSATVYMGEIEQMFRTRGVSAFTLYPGKAYLEIKTRLYNPTSAPQTFLWWANPAVAVNDHTQSVFPPDVHAVMDHGKRDVSAFPIARGVYYKMDYSAGVDISRYRNIPVPTSYMAYHSDYDFVGNYDHQKQAGLLHVADHHISPGKKQWTWGNGEFGRAWDRNLTDEDGPYIELMTGCFTDNQPDFSWLMPYEKKEFTQYFMPYKQIGAVTQATREAAVRLGWENGQGVAAVYTTAVESDARLIIRCGEETVMDTLLHLSPDQAAEIPFSAPEQHLSLRLLSREGRELIACSYEAQQQEELPKPAEEIGPAAEAATNEELFLFGQHIEQYRHATRDPAEYYLEGLRRDPTDARINNAYGKLLMKRGLVAESLSFFEAAIKKLTLRNPNPYDGEPLFNRGVALSYLKQYDLAYDCFYKSTWNAAWQEAGFYRVAAIDMMRKEWEKALEHLDQALTRNTWNMKARNAKTVALGMLHRREEALAMAEESLRMDPLDAIARREAQKHGRDEAWDQAPGLNAHEIIEYALAYAEWGMVREGAEMLRLWAGRSASPEEAQPMLYYHLAYMTGDTSVLAQAEQAKPDFCFPHRLEDRLALEYAVQYSSDCGCAQYYLGNFWYDKGQSDRAIACWERAVSLRDDLPTAHRNLALAYYNKRWQKERALKEMEQAFAMDERDARVFMERDQLYKKLRFPAEKRLQSMTRYPDLTAARDDQYLEYITCLNLLGRHEEALEKLEHRKFHPWEGGEGKVPMQWRIALTQLARQRLCARQPEAALDYLMRAAGSYPHSFGEGKLTGAQENDIDYLMGNAYAMLGQETQARACYEKAAKGLSEPAGMMYYNDQPPEMIYYQGLAREKLGDSQGARQRFERLIDYGKTHLDDQVQVEYFAVSLPDLQIFDESLTLRNRVHCLFMEALGHHGLGQARQAEQCLEALRALEPEHMGALVHLHNGGDA